MSKPKRRRARIVVPRAGPVTITHPDGSVEEKPAYGVGRGSKVVENARAAQLRRAATGAKEAWRRTTST